MNNGVKMDVPKKSPVAAKAKGKTIRAVKRNKALQEALNAADVIVPENGVKLSSIELVGLLADITTYANESSYNRSLEHCRLMLTQTLKYICGGGLLSSDTIQKIGEYIRNKSYYYYAKKDFDKAPAIKGLIIKLVETGFVFDPSVSMYLMNGDRSLIDPIMKGYNTEISKAFLESLSSDEMTKEFADLIKYLVINKNIKVSMTATEREEYITNKNSNSFIVHSLLDDPATVITPEFTGNVARIHNVELLRKVLICGGVLTTIVLEQACLSTKLKTKFDIVKFILDNKIEPTQTAFRNIIESADANDNKGRKYRYYNANNEDDNVKVTNEDVLNLLPNYGYVVTYEDLKLALKKRIVIKNIERFNIKFDASYLHICSEVGMYPYKTTGVTPDLTCLANECKKSGNLTNIKKVILDNKLTPDLVCMREACKHKNNLQTIKYLVSKGGKIDFECLKNVINANYNRTLAHVLEEFEKHNTTTLNNVVNGKADVVVIGKSSKGPVKGSKKIPKHVSDSDSEDDNLDVSDDEQKNSKKTEQTTTQNNKKSNTDEEEAGPDTITETTNLTNDSQVQPDENKTEKNTYEHRTGKTVQKLVSKIPADFSYRNSVYDKISPALRKLLKITPKQKSINYVDFRRAMLEYLKNNELMTETTINLESPFLYNGKTTVTPVEINEWIYTLLLEESVKTSDTVGTAASKKPAKPKGKTVTKSKKIIKDGSNDHEEENEEQSVVTIHDIDIDEIDDDDPSKVSANQDQDAEDVSSALEARRARRSGASKNKPKIVVRSSKKPSEVKQTSDSKTVIKAALTKTKKAKVEESDEKKPVVKKVNKTKGKNIESDNEVGEDEEIEPIKSKKPVPKKYVEPVDEMDEDEEIEPIKSKKPVPKKYVEPVDEMDEDEEIEPIKSKKPVPKKYVESDDEIEPIEPKKAATKKSMIKTGSKSKVVGSTASKKTSTGTKNATKAKLTARTTKSKKTDDDEMVF